jgi:ABC-type multidrug transport system fused ATPase/permease subunit
MLLTSAGECLIYPIGISIVMPYLILVILLCFVLIMFVTRYFRACNREVKRLSSINEGKLLSLLDEMCKGTVTLRVFAKQEWILKEYVHRADNALRTYVLSNAGNLWMEGRLLLIGDLLFASVALFCIIVLAFGLSFEY